MTALLKRFRPTLFFLLRFFVVYLVLSVLYGLFIRHYDTVEPPLTDPVTRHTSQVTAAVLGFFLDEVHIIYNDHLNFPGHYDETTYDSIHSGGQSLISVEEGCNGVNIAILFATFVFGFGGNYRSMAWFIPAGFAALYAANLFRLGLLAFFALRQNEQAFHFFHKYGFTAVIYVFVFALWIIWVRKSLKNLKS